jgi:hypothetical protein
MSLKLIVFQYNSFIPTSKISKNLICITRYPPSKCYLQKLSNYFFIRLFQGVERVQLFVKDFILTQLIGRDINALWNIVNPVGLLGKYLENMNRGPPEPR